MMVQPVHKFNLGLKEFNATFSCLPDDHSLNVRTNDERVIQLVIEYITEIFVLAADI